jgi:hypothetical protein
MTRSLQGPLEKSLGGSRAPLRRKPKVDRRGGGAKVAMQYDRLFI